MIIGFLLPKTVLEEKVPSSFFEGIEESYDVTFHDYGHWYDYEEGMIVLGIGKKVGDCNYADCTNHNAWLEYFDDATTIVEDKDIVDMTEF